MLQPGDHVGRYEIQAVIGEGGFGQVYRAYDPAFKRQVAVKELLAECKATDPAQYAEHLERFKLERQIQGQFSHPYIVSVYDLVEQNGNEHLIEEFVAGGTLRDALEREGHLMVERVIQIGIEMCRAIAAIWELDIVHRDVKPNNILLTKDGHAKLSDFGVSQVGQKSQRTHTDSHHPGTPLYMSPEQEKGYGYLDERSDLYSLGIVLYEALTGKLYKRERVSPRQLNPAVPKTLDEIVMRALEREPDKRYQSAAKFEAALQSVLAKPRTAWLWIVGGIVALALIVGSAKLLIPVPTPETPTPSVTAMVTSQPSPTSTVSTPTATVTQPAMTPTSAPGATSTPATATRMPTPIVTVETPKLTYPRGGSVVNGSRLELRWAGHLPNSTYGYRVNLRHASGTPSYASPALDVEQWQWELPASSVGEWRWFVEVIRRTGTPQVAARSAESIFYHDPFASPLPTPVQ